MKNRFLSGFEYLITPHGVFDAIWKLAVLCCVATLAAIGVHGVIGIPLPLPLAEFYVMIAVIAAPLFLIGMNVAHKNRILQKKLEEMALTDLLTGLDNRRAFFNKVKGQTGALLMMDVDRFKNVNDTHGHDVGDAVLQQIARHLQSCIRADDRVARLGGEEFVILLRNVDRTQLLNIGRRIAGGVVIDDIGTVTLSVGAVEHDDWGNNLPEAMKLADRALYAAKKAGRACIILWPVPEVQSVQKVQSA